MKLILPLILALTFTSCTQAEDKKQTETKQEKQMSEADKKWLEEYMKLEEDGKKIKTELEESRKLGKTLDELTDMLDTKK